LHTLEAIFEMAPSLKNELRGAIRAAASSAPILVLGESGTGRSALTRALHFSSPRRDEPLVEVDPSVIPSSLFESEFFGHEAGAFTGADTPSVGRLARAEGGSLLLDHVEEIPLAVQAKLLRLLAEGWYSPLGGVERPCDVRFLAIGAEDLTRRVERGAFREDLYYRLEVITLRIPPLRSRKEDIPALIDYFLRDLAERFGRENVRLSTTARSWMEEYNWPGNLREIRNLLERALLIDDGAVLDPKPPTSTGDKPRSLSEVEQEEILRALAYTRGHQGNAAEILGISRKTLWEKRKRYGIA